LPDVGHGDTVADVSLKYWYVLLVNRPAQARVRQSACPGAGNHVPFGGMADIKRSGGTRGGGRGGGLGDEAAS